jgi:plasmid maintenance system antidote protein VapI
MAAKPKPKPMPSLEDLLREALVARPVAFRTIEAATGVPNPVLCRFVAGKQTFRLDSADKLARYFGIRILPPKPARKRKG